MLINESTINKIFNSEKILSIKKSQDKKDLSLYTEIIPMYDIYSDSIYPISNINLYYRLVNSHYRFINDEIKQWIINKLNKTTDIKIKEKCIRNLKIIDCYDLALLEKTSYETLYRYSPDLGLSISICKRNSFNPFSKHLSPYYSKKELIKLGMNNGLINNINPSNLVDKALHYKICKKVSKNDISYETIQNHMNNIINNKSIAWVVFYSMTGSYLFNKILRESLPINKYLHDGLLKIIDTMNNSTLPNNYYFYRFVWDDNYIKNLKIGQVFNDIGFISTTRDPFYSPGIKMNFGLILIRINIPKNTNGVGLLIENFSMFPKEEEFIIKPNSKLKLISKDVDTKYLHIDEKFEKLIKKKYEFDLITVNSIPKLKIIDDTNIPEISINTIKLYGNNRLELFNNFYSKCDESGQFRYNNLIFIAQWFDSTSSYQHLYFNKTKDGIIFTYYKNGYPLISIECGETLVINYIRSKCYYDIWEEIDIDKIIAEFGNLFGYSDAIVYFTFKNFTEFSSNYNNNLEFLPINLYCDTIYSYIKNKKIIKNSKYYKYEYGFWKIDKNIKTNIPKEILEKLPKDLYLIKTWGELFIIIVEKHFYLYNRMEDWFNTFLENMLKEPYYIFNIAAYLKSIGRNVISRPRFMHTTTIDRGDLFRLVYDNVDR
jgi:hypothetical protein